MHDCGLRTRGLALPGPPPPPKTLAHAGVFLFRDFSCAGVDREARPLVARQPSPLCRYAKLLRIGETGHGRTSALGTTKSAQNDFAPQTAFCVCNLLIDGVGDDGGDGGEVMGVQEAQFRKFRNCLERLKT